MTARLAVITGTEGHQHVYVALTRGTDANLAYVFTVSPKQADPVPGPRPAPELARYDTINAERAGRSAPATDPALPGTALGVLSAVLGNDGQQLSATQARYQALTDADHLAVLYAIWTAETTPARDQHYRDLLMNALPPGRRAEPGHQARWLWRTLRGAELAGLDPARFLAEAIAERDLAGSRDIPAVIDARIRYRLGSVVPLPPRPWSGQIPAITDPDRRAYAGQIAALTPPGAQRHLAVAADAELRRRHPDQRFTPLRSAEPPAVTAARRAELTPTAGPDILEAGPWIKDLDAGRRSFAARGGRGCWLA